MRLTYSTEYRVLMTAIESDLNNASVYKRVREQIENKLQSCEVASLSPSEQLRSIAYSYAKATTQTEEETAAKQKKLGY